MRTILAVYGTRPEAIKMAPVLIGLRGSAHLQAVVAVTGQHREMLDQVNSLFGIEPDHDLNIFAPGQSLEEITTRTVDGMGRLLTDIRPDAVLVQGDTTTCFAAALSAFYRRAPVIHLEAGLRTGNLADPYPEEGNRRLVAQISSLHLAPTVAAKANLVNEAIDAGRIVVTGNTVIDALLTVVRSALPSPDGRRQVLVTTHRRESWGDPMRRIALAIAELSERFPDATFIVPMHKNPTVRDALVPSLSGRPNVRLVEPMSYDEFARCMAQSDLILTDSGGVQEEAPSLGRPVLVLRETTERPEAVRAGTVRLVGTQTERIIHEVARLLTDRDTYVAMANAVNPYGDGHAAQRCLMAIEHYFGYGPRPEEFGMGERV